MKVVAFSDVVLTDCSPLIELLDAIGPKYVVFAGDGLKYLSDGFFESLNRHRKIERFLFVAGNNDYPADKERVITLGGHDLHKSPYVDGKAVFVGQEGMVVKSTYAKRGYWQPHVYTEQQVKKHLVEQKGDIDYILVSHTPPQKILDFSASGKHHGAKSVFEYCESQNVILNLFGHVHFSGGNQRNVNGVSYLNIASFESQAADSLRVAEIDICSEVKTQWHALPKTTGGESFGVLNVRNAPCEASCLAALNQVRDWRISPEQEPSTDSRELERAISQGCPLATTCALYDKPITNKLKSELRFYYENDNKLCRFIVEHFNPWPEHLGPGCMVEMYKQGITPESVGNYDEFMELISSSKRQYFKKFVRKGIADKYKQLVVNWDVIQGLQSHDLVFLDREYANRDEYIVMGFQKVEEVEGHVREYEWLERGVGVKSTKSFLSKTFSKNDSFIHFSPSADKYLKGKLHLDLNKLIYDNMFSDFEGYCLNDLVSFFSKFTGLQFDMDSKFIIEDYQKHILSLANYIYPTDSHDASFQVLRNVCKADIESIKFLYRCLLSLKERGDVIYYCSKPGKDEFFSLDGKAYC
ncbi:metallophosphoesterase [uncultured Pseudodesulfovibrio sp.]|uniref:metallophosphoesterase family protein n=1 Tax=uncultured Pseudodesulfovibrio sp. TaxID=2035858 RepID=UPI0029C71FC1|nr:metallophosphoesterase [uncultured Pseudodesulfovibrio sp.]